MLLNDLPRVFDVVFAAIQPQSDQCWFAQGLRADLKRRLPHYISDYKDGTSALPCLTVWPAAGVMFRTLDLRLNGRGFDSRPCAFRQHTGASVIKQSSIFGTGQRR